MLFGCDFLEMNSEQKFTYTKLSDYTKVSKSVNNMSK